jgi:hypothetical protein
MASSPAQPHGPGSGPPPRASGRWRSNAATVGAVVLLVAIAFGIRFRASILAALAEALRPRPVIAADGREYRWRSVRPVVDDFDGDGVDDVLGLIEEPTSGPRRVWLTAWSGADWRVLWQFEVELRPMPEDIRFAYARGRALLIAGRSLTVFDVERSIEAQASLMLWRSEYPLAIIGVWISSSDARVELSDGQRRAIEVAGLRSPSGSEPSRLPDDQSEALDDFVLTPERIYRVEAGRLHVFDARTDALIRVLGDRQ